MVKKIKFFKIPITVILLILFVNNFSEGMKIQKTNDEKIKELVIRQIEEENRNKLTPVNVWDKIVEYKIEHPRIVFSQVMLETGNLKSDGAKIDNNLFGFYKKGEHKIFDTWEESIIYYKSWQDKKYNGGNYYSFLNKVGYAKDSLYITKLIQIQKLLIKKYGME